MSSEKVYYVVGAPIQVMKTSFTSSSPTGPNPVTEVDIIKSLKSAAYVPSIHRMRAFDTLELAQEYADHITKDDLKQPIADHYINYTPVATVRLGQSPHEDMYSSGPKGIFRMCTTSFNDISSIVGYFYRFGTQLNPQSASIECNIPQNEFVARASASGSCRIS